MALNVADKIELLRQILIDHYGPLMWWPGNTGDEIAIGAILTQNTSWSNVETALEQLRLRNLLSFQAIGETDTEDLAPLIRSSGYYNQKAKKLKILAAFLQAGFDGSLAAFLKSGEPQLLRQQLLSIWGIGKETADAILLYVGHHPVFVIDAYTIRIFSRHSICSTVVAYDELQAMVQAVIPADVGVYNEFHAGLVRIGKDFCHRRNPACDQCPFQGI